MTTRRSFIKLAAAAGSAMTFDTVLALGSRYQSIGYFGLHPFIDGQLVEVLADGWKAPGSHMAVWNAHNQASGTYFYRFRCGDFAETRKMTLLK
jgi:hypothetical protein